MPIVLIIIAILLIIINYRALKKEDRSFEKILVEREENVDDNSIEIGKLRREFSETILELQLEIERLKAIKNIDETDDNEINTIDLTIDDAYSQNETEEENEKAKTKNDNLEPKTNKVEAKTESLEQNSISDKARAVKQLVDDGFTDDRICETLGIGKGEVLLIKGLYKK